ncbi:MAG: PEP-CTERM sorting domain-containing protein [Armatimonadetes bacterium]|nr:PEP-CTERM sorting domain-containing protein [Armatimonadota bacterium]MBS1702664.1 PEP-CTERM sorting domain-containing protein [Armatimonadota bacterium]MBS1726657.1 PEP-CTERM sorting domain-containing protein [Armatimonadota bacterium]
MKLRAILVLSLGGCFGVANANLIQNSDFSLVGPNGSPTTHVGIGAMGSSSADFWAVLHNTNGVTTTQLVDTGNLLPAVAPTGATTGILMTSTAANNGLIQKFSNVNDPATFDVWVWVLQGQVSIGIGAGASTVTSATSSGINYWQHLTAVNNDSLSNNVVIYSAVPSVYYATSANVSTVPEPASIAVLGLGALALVRRRRK